MGTALGSPVIGPKFEFLKQFFFNNQTVTMEAGVMIEHGGLRISVIFKLVLSLDANIRIAVAGHVRRRWVTSLTYKTGL